VGSDLGFAEIEGPRTPITRFLNGYISKLHVAAQEDADVSITFLRMINMVAPPSRILHHKIVWRVLKGNSQTSQRSVWSKRLINFTDCSSEALSS
jgi:hypothetical protein